MKLACVLSAFVIVLFYSCNNPTEQAGKSTKEEPVSETKAVEPTLENQSETQPCIWQVYEIVESSDKFKELTAGLEERIKKNGGTTYGLLLEGSPDPEKDSAMAYSETYDISLHESYPDRMVNLARFTFDKRNLQLYQYDAVNDTLRSIVFDKKLLLHLCK